MRYIQFTTTYHKDGPVDRNVQRYEEAEMEEIFDVHERLWLAQGKIVERENNTGKTEIVDLQAFFFFDFKRK